MLHRAAHLPATQWHCNAQHILICGWSDTTFMCWLLRELDSGPVRVAAGSRATLLNIHSTDAIMEQARRDAQGILDTYLAFVGLQRQKLCLMKVL